MSSPSPLRALGDDDRQGAAAIVGKGFGADHVRVIVGFVLLAADGEMVLELRIVCVGDAHLAGQAIAILFCSVRNAGLRKTPFFAPCVTQGSERPCFWLTP